MPKREQARCNAAIPHTPHGWPGMLGGQRLQCDGGRKPCPAAIVEIRHTGHYWGVLTDGPHWCDGVPQPDREGEKTHE